MQEFHLLPSNQRCITFVGFPDSNTKQDCGSTVRSYQLTVLKKKSVYSIRQVIGESG